MPAKKGGSRPPFPLVSPKSEIGLTPPSPSCPIKNTVVQSIELQGNRCGTGKSRQNSRGTDIAKFAGAALLMTVQFTDNTGVTPV